LGAMKSNRKVATLWGKKIRLVVKRIAHAQGNNWITAGV